MTTDTIATRTATTTWWGDLAKGTGRIDGYSEALDDLPVTWAARTERPAGTTSPEELTAAAHSSCFSMALALRLGEHDLTADRLSVTSSVTLASVDELPTVVSANLEVVAAVPGTDTAQFLRIVEEAATLCPISRLFTGAEINVEASLEPTP